MEEAQEPPGVREMSHTMIWAVVTQAHAYVKIH